MINEFGDCAGMPDTYRGWSISYVSHPLPGRRGDWLAVNPDYNGWEEHGWDIRDNSAEAATREELIAAIDAWILEN